MSRFIRLILNSIVYHISIDWIAYSLEDCHVCGFVAAGPVSKFDCEVRAAVTAHERNKPITYKPITYKPRTYEYSYAERFRVLAALRCEDSP